MTHFTSLTFIAKLHLFSFDIQTGMSEGYLFCPAYDINTYVQLSYSSYCHLLDITKSNKYGKQYNHNTFIIDRCFVKSILDNSF
jgi:hypothetical protein